MELQDVILNGLSQNDKDKCLMIPCILVYKEIKTVKNDNKLLGLSDVTKQYGRGRDRLEVTKDFTQGSWKLKIVKSMQ